MSEEQAIKYIDDMYQKRMDSIETKDGVICLRELGNVEFTDLELAGLILLRYNHFKDNEITKLQQENENLRATIKNDDVAVNNLCKEIENLKQQLKDKDEKISKAIEYITSYESISIIQNLENAKENIKLDEKTTIEMCRRYLIVHDKILEILESNKED